MRELVLTPAMLPQKGCAIQKTHFPDWRGFRLLSALWELRKPNEIKTFEVRSSAEINPFLSHSPRNRIRPLSLT
jgi:hypothetical protein